ncbi:MAG: hypothetical protein ACPGJU_11815, partial [Coraliomargarita sp.]
ATSEQRVSARLRNDRSVEHHLIEDDLGTGGATAIGTVNVETKCDWRADVVEIASQSDDITSSSRCGGG